MEDALKQLLATLDGPTAEDAVDAMLGGKGRVNDHLAKTPAQETGLDTQALRIETTAVHGTLSHTGIANAAAQIERLPPPGHSVHCIMGGNYHGFDIIPAIQRLAASEITRLTIATLSFSKRNLSQLALMIDQRLVRAVDLLTSDYFAKADALIYQAAHRELMEMRTGHKLAFTRNHAKVICLELADGRTYTVESSANLRSCVNFEQFAIHSDPGLFHWHREWIDYLLAVGGK